MFADCPGFNLCLGDRVSYLYGVVANRVRHQGRENLNHGLHIPFLSKSASRFAKNRLAD